MDWKKLSEEVKELEEAREQEEERAQSAPAPKPRIGDTLLHPVLGRCTYAGTRGDGLLYIRRPDGRVTRLAPDRIQINTVAGQPRTFTITVRKV